MSLRNRGVAVILASFIAVILAQDALRTDLSPVEHWVSHLSLGPLGWINSAALVIAGAAVLALRGPLRQASHRRWPTRWITVAGVGLIIAGLFASDAPPGTSYHEAITWHGRIHDIGGGLTFLGLVATCLVTRDLISRRWGIVIATFIAVAWVAASVMGGLAYAQDAPTLPSGLAERAALFAGIGWMVALAVRLRSAEHGRTPR